MNETKTCGTRVPFIKTIINYLAVFNVFAGGFSWYRYDFAETRLSYFIMVFFLIIWLFFLKKSLYLNKNFVLLFLCITVSSLCNILVDRHTISLFLKQFAAVSLNALFFYVLIKYNDYDVKKLFTIYLNIAFVVALIGILQETSFFIDRFWFDFKAYDFRPFIPTWRYFISPKFGLLIINSILPEPSDLGNVLMPAFFVSLVSFLGNKFKFQGKIKSIIIIAAVILSYTTVVYIAIILSFLLLVFNYPKNKIVLSCLLGVGILLPALLFNDNHRYKIIQPVSMLFERKEFSQLNTSSFALCSNAMVASYSFKKNPVFGSGLGSHQKSYGTYFNQVYTGSKDLPSSIPLNTKDAYSLFLRLLSETGLFGLGTFFFFIFRSYIHRTKDGEGYLWIISNAILCMFFYKLMRMGNYFVDGFFFFLWMYYFTKKKSIPSANFGNKL